MKKILSILLLSTLTVPAWSASDADSMMGDPAVQEYVAAMRSEFSSGKVGAINDVLSLNAEEAGVFWPIYQRYETELFALGDRRLALIEDFVRATAGDAINDEFAAKIATDWFKLQADHLKLLKKYHEEVAASLSPLQATQFIQLEHRFNTVTDLLIASELPLIDPHLPTYLKALAE